MAINTSEVAKQLTAAMVPELDLPKDADTAAVQVAHLYWTMVDALEEFSRHDAVPAQKAQMKVA